MLKSLYCTYSVSHNLADYNVVLIMMTKSEKQDSSNLLKIYVIAIGL